MKELHEGITVDELLGEITVVGDVTLEMTMEFPGFNGEMVYMPEAVSCRGLIILPKDAQE